MKEAGDIFREVAQAAGDIVFRYDLKTKKFMQYSDKSELSKYGSWLQDFDFANFLRLSGKSTTEPGWQ